MYNVSYLGVFISLTLFRITHINLHHHLNSFLSMLASEHLIVKIAVILIISYWLYSKEY